MDIFSDDFGFDDDDDDSSNVIEQLQHDAELGDAEAMLNLGLAFQEGDGIDKDFKKAVEWFERAVTKGNTHAMIELVMCYVKGLGVPKPFMIHPRVNDVKFDVILCV